MKLVNSWIVLPCTVPTDHFLALITRENENVNHTTPFMQKIVPINGAFGVIVVTLFLY